MRNRPGLFDHLLHDLTLLIVQVNFSSLIQLSFSNQRQPLEYRGKRGSFYPCENLNLTI